MDPRALSPEDRERIAQDNLARRSAVLAGHEEPAKPATTLGQYGCLGLIAAFFIFIVIFVVTAGIDDDNTPASRPRPTVSDESLYVVTVRGVGDVASVSDATLIRTGREVCGALDRGASVAEIALIAATEGGSNGGFIVGAAIPAFCPRHQTALDQFLG